MSLQASSTPMLSLCASGRVAWMARQVAVPRLRHPQPSPSWPRCRRGRLRSVAPAVAPADGSAGVANGGSGYADTSNSGPTWAASQASLRDHAVRLKNWRWCYCLCRSCEGYCKASNGNQP